MKSTRCNSNVESSLSKTLFFFLAFNILEPFRMISTEIRMEAVVLMDILVIEKDIVRGPEPYSYSFYLARANYCLFE